MLDRTANATQFLVPAAPSSIINLNILIVKCFTLQTFSTTLHRNIYGLRLRLSSVYRTAIFRKEPNLMPRYEKMLEIVRGNAVPFTDDNG